MYDDKSATAIMPCVYGLLTRLPAPGQRFASASSSAGSALPSFPRTAVWPIPFIFLMMSPPLGGPPRLFKCDFASSPVLPRHTACVPTCWIVIACLGPPLGGPALCQLEPAGPGDESRSSVPSPSEPKSHSLPAHEGGSFLRS